MTGADFLNALKDGREVYIYGDRVEDVTTHPAFRNTARMIARLYDALHDSERQKKIVAPIDTGNGGVTHAYFKAPKTLEDLLQGRSAIAEWARMTYGWMGRAPYYKASFLATLGANADFYDPYQANALRWYRFCQERVPFINHAIIHPPVDRDRPPNEVADERCRVHHGQGAGALGERVRLRRHGPREQFLSAHRLPAAIRRPWLHAPRGEARLHRRASAQGGRGVGPRTAR
jgi:aromatic ring hydroxylase